MRKIFFWIFLCVSLTSWAQNNHEKTSAREQQLLQELRCLVCQNESLAESDAPLAKDLRHIVHLQITQGKNNEEIVHYLTGRYGEFILFKPVVNSHNSILWGAPFVFLVCGLVICVLVIRRSRS